MNKLGFIDGKKQPRIDRDRLCFAYMVQHAIAEKRGELPDEKKWQIIKELSEQFAATERTVYQYIKEEITALRKPDPDSRMALRYNTVHFFRIFLDPEVKILRIVAT